MQPSGSFVATLKQSSLVQGDSVGISCPHSDMFEKAFIRCPRRQHFKTRRSIITTKYIISDKLAFQNKSDSHNRIIAQELFSCTKTPPLCKRHTKIQY